MKRIVTGAVAALALLTTPLFAKDVADMSPRDGFMVVKTSIGWKELVDRVKEAAKAEKMGVVTQAGPTEAAKKMLDETIPGNRIIGVYRPDFAVRALRASTAAMIEAPIRFYVTEDADGGSTLSWKTPSAVFGPYMADAKPELATVASELDAIFEAIGKRAVAQ